MVIKNLNADYSNCGLGNTDFIKNFVAQSGIAEVPLRNMYNSAVSANIWPKIGGIAVFAGATAATQKLVFKEVPYGQPFPEMTFVGLGAHSADGYTPANGVYAISPFILPAGSQDHVSVGFYNNTSETVPPDGNSRSMLSVSGEATDALTANYKIELSRVWQNTVLSPLGQLGTRFGGSANQIFPSSGSTDITKKGLLQLVKDGDNLRLIDNGLTVQTNLAATQRPIGGGNRKMLVGATMNSDGTIIPNRGGLARLSLVYWGSLTMAEAVTFNTIVNTFLTAIGRAAV